MTSASKTPHIRSTAFLASATALNAMAIDGVSLNSKFKEESLRKIIKGTFRMNNVRAAKMVTDSNLCPANEYVANDNTDARTESDMENP